MIICDVFAGDTNDALKTMQHDAYGKLIGYLFHYPRERFVKACNLLESELEIKNRLVEIDGFDLRVLQDCYDCIAAYYRYRIEDITQLELPGFLTKYRGDPIENKWYEFFHREVQRLTESDIFTRAIVIAVVCENTEAGYYAEQLLGKFIVSEYCMSDWAPRYAKSYP
jgi:hypothetical protein